MSKPVQALPAALAAPIDATQTSFSIRGLKDSRGNYITAMVGTLMHATLEPRSVANQELISWTGITNLGDGLITVTGVTRNINPQPPYDALTGVVAHASGVEVILTDTAKMWSEYPNVNETNTVNAQWTFGVRPRATGADTDPTALVTKAELAAASITPGALGNVTVSGTAAESITAQNVVWNDPASGTWRVANGNVLAELEGTILGIALGSATIGNPITPGVAVEGRVSGFSGLTAGLVYASDTGTVSNTPGTNSKVIGIAVSATDILFDPLFKYTLTISQIAALAGGGTFGTPSGSNKFATQNYVATLSKFNGTGADGALSISTGTTTLDLGGSAVFTKNYTSISITGTASLAFTNPHPNGTVIILKSQGDVTITSSATAAIDTRGMGASGGNVPTGILAYTNNPSGVSAGFGGTGGTPGPQYDFPSQYLTSSSQLYRKTTPVVAGAGGGAGGGADVGSGSGGAGGGALLIQVGGALNFTGTINASGNPGGVGSNNAAGRSGAGGGGGSAATVAILANSITANSGTITASGGVGGNSGTGSAGTGSSGKGGGGAGSLQAAGGAGVQNSDGGAASGLGAGGAGAGSSSNASPRVGGAAGGSIGGLVALNTELY